MRNYEIYQGDCIDAMGKMDSQSVDTIITDPPYELNFMSKGWDNAGISFRPDTWRKCYEVLKPGGYLLAFGGSRTFHRIACAIEDAGFEIRDTIMWLYGSGFPKSMNIGLAIDKKNGVESEIVGEITSISNVKIKKATNEWNGWGTALKPSFEPIIVARKPFKSSLVDNVIEYGVGGINIDECRVSLISGEVKHGGFGQAKTGFQKGIGNSGDKDYKCEWVENTQGRFPANTILTYDETDFDEVCGGFPNTSPTKKHGGDGKLLDTRNMGWGFRRMPCNIEDKGGSASRYFYCAKASKKDRDEGLDEFEEKNTMCGRNPYNQENAHYETVQGRFPANTILTYDETDFDEVCGGFPNTKSQYRNVKESETLNKSGTVFETSGYKNRLEGGFNDSGSASRYFYCAKASKKDRDEGLDRFEEKNTMCDRNPELASANMPQNRSGNLRKNTHPTVKPTSLMQYLVRLVAPKGATILDPFMGSGSTGKAVAYENKERNAGYKFIGIEQEPEYCKIAEARIKFALGGEDMEEEE